MRIEAKNNWIDLRGIERSRTYYFKDRPPIVVIDPLELFVRLNDAHSLLCTDNQIIEIPETWYAFTADGDFGVSVAETGGVDSRWEEVDPVVEALDFHITAETIFRVRKPVKTMIRSSESVKIQQSDNRIAYIRKGWRYVTPLIKPDI
jgi:hypothetical protein